MAEDDLIFDIVKGLCAAAWIIFFLMLKNFVLLIIMAVQRKKNAMYRIPEDVTTFGAGQQQQENANDWSLAGRIQRVLANDTEYVPYFMVLLVFMFFSVGSTSQITNHYLSRVLIYGILFVVGRYLHTIGYLIRNSYARILGFLITVLVIFILSIDHAYYFSKRLYNYKL